MSWSMATTFLISRLKRIYIRAYDNIFAYFKENSELIATDLRKVQALDAATKMIWQSHFKGNLKWSGNATMFFVIDEVKE